MSALSGKQVACLTKDVLQKMRNDTSFRSFYDVLFLKSKRYTYSKMESLLIKTLNSQDKIRRAKVYGKLYNVTLIFQC